MRRTWKRGMTIGPLVAAVSGAGVLGWVVLNRWTLIDREAALRESGLRPSILAAAGVGGSGAASTLLELDTEAATLSTIASLRSSGDALIGDIRALESDVAAEPWRSDIEQALLAKRSALAQTRAGLLQERDILLVSACEWLGQDRIDSVSAACHAPIELDETEILVIGLSDLELRRVKRAVVAERRAIRLEEAVPEQHRTLLEEIRTRLDVTTARMARQSNEAAVRLAFLSYLE